MPTCYKARLEQASEVVERRAGVGEIEAACVVRSAEDSMPVTAVRWQRNIAESAVMEAHQAKLLSRIHWRHHSSMHCGNQHW
jgi:hypothetical protein